MHSLKRLLLVAAAAITALVMVQAPSTSALSLHSINSLRGRVTSILGQLGIPVSMPAPNPTNNYAALGDSVAAGLGLDGSQLNIPCGQSIQGYPNIVAQDTGLPLINATCSGATTGDLITGQVLAGTGGSLPSQLSVAFKSGTPKLISITAGANDVDWASLISKCETSTCGNGTDTAQLQASAEIMKAKLNLAILDVVHRSGMQPPRIVLTGYYNPVSQACAALPGSPLTSSEVSWMTDRVNQVNANLKSVADKYPFVSFANVDFTGHDLCSADSWIQSKAASAPLHPTAAGQQAIAKAVEAAAK